MIKNNNNNNNNKVTAKAKILVNAQRKLQYIDMNLGAIRWIQNEKIISSLLSINLLWLSGYWVYLGINILKTICS